MSTYSAYTDFSQLKNDCLSSYSAYCQKNQPENALSQLLLAAYYEFSGCIDNYTAYCYGLQGIYSKKDLKALFVPPCPDSEMISGLRSLKGHYKLDMADDIYKKYPLPLCVCTVEEYKQILEELFSEEVFQDKKWANRFRENYIKSIKF